MARPNKSPSGWAAGFRFLRWKSSSREGSPAHPLVFNSAQRLQTAIEAASFVTRHSNDDGERVIVFAAALGGGWIYTREEFKSRVANYFPGLAPKEVSAALRLLEDRLRCYLKPFKREKDYRDSWVHGWHGDY